MKHRFTLRLIPLKKKKKKNSICPQIPVSLWPSRAEVGQPCMAFFCNQNIFKKVDCHFAALAESFSEHWAVSKGWLAVREMFSGSVTKSLSLEIRSAARRCECTISGRPLLVPGSYWVIILAQLQQCHPWNMSTATQQTMGLQTWTGRWSCDRADSTVPLFIEMVHRRVTPQRGIYKDPKQCWEEVHTLPYAEKDRMSVTT